MPTWREVARALGERMQYPAQLAGTNNPDFTMLNDGCCHDVAHADPDNCPFCADRAAYLLWLKKEKDSR